MTTCSATRLTRFQSWKAVLTALLFFVSIVGLSQTTIQNVSAATQGTNLDIDRVEIGFAGKIVLGRWVPIQVHTLSTLDDDQVVTVEVLDGDAVPVRYTLQPATNGSAAREGLVRFGRATGITVRIGSGDEVVSERRFSIEEVQADHSFLPGTTRLLLMLGPKNDQQVEAIALKREQVDEFVVVQDPNQLPTKSSGLESVRSIVVLPIDSQFIEKLDADRANALVNWCSLGGHILLTGGAENSRYFGPTSLLKQLTPGTLGAVQETRDTGTIELLTKSNDPLVSPATASLKINTIQADDPSSVLFNTGDLPLLIRKPFGFGSITYCSVDFTSKPLSQWSARNELFALALGVREAEENVGIKTTSGRVSHIGYDDMSGQLRASLDQFRRVSFITFTSVALLVALFILLIGPGDYFFLRKFTKGKMQLTWLTFSLLALSFCGLAWYLNSRTKSNEVELNQVEIIDIDAKDGITRGFTWAHLYSPGTGNYSVKLANENQLIGKIDERYLAWQGLPGSGLGSMQSRSELGLYRKPYNNDDGIQNLPLQNASTKTLVGRWNGKTETAINSNLRQSPSSDALLGSFTNPLDAKLYDCILLYGDWVYILEDRALEAGDNLLVEDDLRETTVKGYFTRTGSLDGNKESAAWNPSSTRPADILKMMCFFDAIGGETYTRLTNNFHPEVDLSHQLEMGNAILVGQVGNVTTPLSVNDKLFDRYDKQISLVRIVFPVKARAKPKR